MTEKDTVSVISPQLILWDSGEAMRPCARTFGALGVRPPPQSRLQHAGLEGWINNIR